MKIHFSRLGIYSCFLFIVFFAFPVWATQGLLESKEPFEKKTIDEVQDLIEIDGLIIDRTITRLGRDFYSAFSMKVNNKYNNLEVNLTVKERPTALSGSIITVVHFERIIYRSSLSPGQREADEKAEQAVQSINQYLVKWKAEKLFSDTFDLGSSEI
ncbi:curli production assembly/transport protein CsgE [Aliivibrio fischeri]|uniref:curli production assembly/transport protein CsgE n=1 Tax=Aliivibrio fischeri TaxID=668 RepID=UPI00080EB898|nr:curli production assembly/transport protein CsgE [Aliivibrio fischeri]OCH47276.1 curli production assembly protein CsgE [Aliivibrio fischeri]